MKKSERAEIVQKRLNQFYPNPPIPLQHKDNYTLLISVLLSAQCTDARVNKITPILFAKADTSKKMIKMTPAQIRSIIKPCGLSPKKSQAIYKLSHILLNKHNGQVPDTFESLEELPGVGHKTASVVMSQAFGHPAFPVDTHIHRLAQRWKLTKGKGVTETEKDLKNLFCESTWNKLHLQIVYYGREHCQARVCYGLVCPICTELFPKRKKPVITNKP